MQTGEWADSGLGDALRAAIANPDGVSLIPWKPYGPSYGALASFLPTGIKDADGELIGVFSTQMPPQAQSIDQVEEDCSLEAIAAAYEGAINFAGLGKPPADQMDDPVPCFPGYSATLLAETIDLHLLDGYPSGNEVNKVTDIYNDVKMNPADGTCVFTYAVKYLLENEGYTINQIRRPDDVLYRKFYQFIKTTIDQHGASGHLKFEGNDKPGLLAIQQVEGSMMLKGTITTNGSSDLSINGGPSNESWQPAHPDPPPPPDSFPYLAFQVLIPALCICCPAIAGCIRGA